MSDVSKRRLRLHVLATATAMAISSMCAVPAMAAGRVDASGLQAPTQNSFDRFIVKYRDGSSERMRNRESSSSSDDLGTSSDRAMFSDRTSSESRSGSSSSERGIGSSEERNRELDQEQCEQEMMPERGRQSER